jgi:hypothetical protein
MRTYKQNRFPFPVSALTRKDLDERGFDSTKVDDRVMSDIVARLAQDFARYGFQNGLESWAQYYRIPKRSGTIPEHQQVDA